MRIGPAVPVKEQAKDRGKALASLGTTAAFALAAVLYVMLSGCTKPAGDIKSFIDWVKGAEGQKVVSSVGYFPLK